MSQSAVAIRPFAFAPPPAAYTPGYFVAQFQNLQRAIPVSSIRTVTTDQTLSVLDQTVLVDAAAGVVTVTLPPVASCLGLILTVKKVDATGNGVTIIGIVDNTVNPTLSTTWQAKMMQSDGERWNVIANV